MDPKRHDGEAKRSPQGSTKDPNRSPKAPKMDQEWSSRRLRIIQPKRLASRGPRGGIWDPQKPPKSCSRCSESAFRTFAPETTKWTKRDPKRTVWDSPGLQKDTQMAPRSRAAEHLGLRPDFRLGLGRVQESLGRVQGTCPPKGETVFLDAPGPESRLYSDIHKFSSYHLLL